MLNLEKIFSGKIRIRLLTRLLLNPETKVYLRGLEKGFGVSSNTVRLELNKFSEMKLIELEDQLGTSSTKTKKFRVNKKHPLFGSLRGIVLKYVGLDQIAEELIGKLGNVEKVYLTGDLAAGKNSPFVDLIMVGAIDKAYVYKLIEKAETLIDKKIRIALYKSQALTEKKLKEVGVFMKLMG